MCEYTDADIGTASDPKAIITRQKKALQHIREIMTTMNGCLDYLDVLGKIDEAVADGLGEKSLYRK